jgi:hypothetical protein
MRLIAMIFGGAVAATFVLTVIKNDRAWLREPKP